MDKNNLYNDTHSVKPELVQELESVIAIAQDHYLCKEEVSLAIMRVVQGLTMEEWEELSAKYQLDEWLAISICKDKTEALEEVLDRQKKLAFQRDHDPLTGIPNRRFFYSTLEVELQRAQRTDSELSLILLDLDDFKKVNDTYGHLCGDMVLKTLATVLSSSIRSYDMAARIGGEEFVVLLPSTSINSAALVAENIRKDFAKKSFECSGKSFLLTLSAGVTSLIFLGRDPKPSDLVGSADQAMYMAKEQGKNRVVTVGSPYTPKDRDSLVGSLEKQFLYAGKLPE